MGMHAATWDRVVLVSTTTDKLEFTQTDVQLHRNRHFLISPRIY